MPTPTHDLYFATSGGRSATVALDLSDSPAEILRAELGVRRGDTTLYQVEGAADEAGVWTFALTPEELSQADYAGWDVWAATAGGSYQVVRGTVRPVPAAADGDPESDAPQTVVVVVEYGGQGEPVTASGALIPGPAGPSAYASYLATTDDEPPLAEAEWVASLDGEAATIEVGAVTVLPPDAEPTVENEGTPQARVVNLGIPGGPPGRSLRATEQAGGILVERETAPGVWEVVGTLTDGSNVTAVDNGDGTITVFQDDAEVGTLTSGADGVGVPEPTGAPAGQVPTTDGAGGYELRPVAGVTAREIAGADLATVVLADTFNRADGPIGSAPTGQTWQAGSLGGLPSVSAGRSASTGGYRSAVAEVGTADQDVRARVTSVGPDLAGVYAAYADADNHVRAGTNGRLYVDVFTGGALNRYQTPDLRTIQPGGASIEVRVLRRDRALWVFVDGHRVADVLMTQAEADALGTRAGFFHSDGGANSVVVRSA